MGFIFIGFSLRISIMEKGISFKIQIRFLKSNIFNIFMSSKNKKNWINATLQTELS